MEKLRTTIREQDSRFSRRDTLKVAGVAAGALAAVVGVGGLIYRAVSQYEDDNAPVPISELDNDFMNPVLTQIPPAVGEAGAWAQKNSYPGVPTAETVPSIPPLELKPLVDQWTIAERISLSSGEPLKMLLVMPDGRALLTPMAKPFPYAVDAETQKSNADIFNWRNHTTWTILEQHGSPMLYGHEGEPDLFFDAWSNFLRKPTGGGYVSRSEAEQQMRKNLLGAKVYMFQSTDENNLPQSVNDINFKTPNVRVVELEVTAGLFFPRFAKVSAVDSAGKPLEDIQTDEKGNIISRTPRYTLMKDGTGYTVDWISDGYNRHTNDFYDWVKQVYPDDTNDPQDTHDLFQSLPDTGNTLGIKFCMRPLSGDPPLVPNAKDATGNPIYLDRDGNPVYSVSYGRFFMGLRAKRATALKIPTWSGSNA